MATQRISEAVSRTVTLTVSIGDAVLKAGKTGGNIYNDGGTVISRGYNLSSDNGGGYLNGPGDQINTDPMLGPLQDNGGPTSTHALLPGSLAIDAGDPNFTPPPFYDQRGPGFPRVMNGRIDIGSFEVQGPTPTPTPTATPCASVGAWAEQSPYPIVTSGQAVASQGGNVYSFGGIANNVAIANAYKYSPRRIPGRPSLPFRTSRLVQRHKRRHLHLPTGRRGPKLHYDCHALALRPDQQYL